MKGDRNSNAGRRRFLQLIGGGVLLLPISGLPGCSGGGESESAGSGAPAANPPPASPPRPSAPPPPAEAAASTPPPASADLPHLSLDDAQAKALSYVHDATTVDAAQQPRYQSGQACRNCVLFQGDANAEWAACSLFPGRAVNANGWCSAFAPKG